MTTSKDDKVWQVYARRVRPLKGKTVAPKASLPPAPKPEKPQDRPAPRSVAKRVQEETDFTKPIDRHLERRMQEGDVPIKARLDLHGLTQKEAHEALLNFLEKKVSSGARYLLIITGKGPKGEGVLRASLPGWLRASPLAARILALRPAAPHHGGNGAFYVLLKRDRP
jgi:DNA-nicking Smr family endonuclease